MLMEKLGRGDLVVAPDFLERILGLKQSSVEIISLRLVRRPVSTEQRLVLGELEYVLAPCGHVNVVRA